MANNPPSVVFVESGDVAPFPVPWGAIYAHTFLNGRKPVYYKGAYYDFILTSDVAAITCTIRAYVSTDQVNWAELDATNAPLALYQKEDKGNVSGFYDLRRNDGVFSFCFQDTVTNELNLIDFNMAPGGVGSWGTVVTGGPLPDIGAYSQNALPGGGSGLISSAIVKLSTGMKVVIFQQSVSFFGFNFSQTFLVTYSSGSWGSPVRLDDATLGYGELGIWYSKPLQMLVTPSDVVIPVMTYNILDNGRFPFLCYTTWTLGGGSTGIQLIGLPSDQYVWDGGSGFYDPVDDSINLALTGFTCSSYAGPISAGTFYFVKGSGISTSPSFSSTNLGSVGPGFDSLAPIPVFATNQTLAEGDNSTGAYKFMYVDPGAALPTLTPTIQVINSSDRGTSWGSATYFADLIMAGWPFVQTLTWPLFLGNFAATVYSAGTAPAIAISLAGDPDDAETFTEFYFPGTPPAPGGPGYIASKGFWVLG